MATAARPQTTASAVRSDPGPFGRVRGADVAGAGPAAGQLAGELAAGDANGDPGLADLQEEARRGLPTADLADRVVATARKPADPA